MMPAKSLYSGKHNALVDAEDVTEIARQMFQDRLLTRCMGGILPELSSSQLAQCHTVLDVGSGPGNWVIDVAFAHPMMQVVGIDISPGIVSYATAQALSQGLDNVHFETMDATQPLEFADASFDLVNARFAQSFVYKDQWNVFLRECLRVVRPGGIVRITEGDWGLTNSPACERFISILNLAYYRSGRSFSQDGRHLGLVTMLSRLLKESGWIDVRRAIYPLDYSADMELHAGTCQNFLVSLRVLKSFLLDMEAVKPEEFEQLYYQAQREMLLDDFCGLGYFVTAWASKPL